MIKENISFLRKFEFLVDVAIAVIAFYWGYPYFEYTPILVIFIATWCMLLYLQGLYESFRIKQQSNILIIIWSAAFLGIGIFGAMAYLFKLNDLNRFFVIFIFCGAAALTSLEKIVVMFFLKHIRQNGYNYRNILIVGTGPRAQQFMHLIKTRNDWGFKIVGLVDDDISLKNKQINGFSVLGTLLDIPDIVHENVVDEIVFIVPRSWMYKIEKICFFCETEGIKVHIALDIFDLKFTRAKQTEMENFLLLTFERGTMKVWHLFFKSLFDILFSGVLLIVLMPVFALTALAIKLTSNGPIFYRQIRCGLNGRKFTLYKFRTMVENAEQMLDQLMKNNEMTGPVFKMENDPRITDLGRFLRKFSIDELPQLWNVLKREMSIVGPRPPLPSEVKRYDSWQRRRLSMRPGITCLWQVQGRNKITDFNQWASLDLKYIDNWSFMMDIKILLKTIPTVLFGIGAK